MREVFVFMKYNLTTLKIYFKQGRKFKFFCQIGLKYRKKVSKSMNTLLAILKVTGAIRDVILAGGLTHRFPWRHLSPCS